MFITAFISARHLSISWASSIQSIPPHPASWIYIEIWSSHLRLGLPTGLFPSGFSTKTLYTPLLSPHMCYMHRPSNSSRFYHPKNIGWGIKVEALRVHKLYYHMANTVQHLALICALVSLYQINTDDCAHALSKHHIIDTICHSDVLRPVKGLPQGVQSIHSSSKANKMCHQ